MGIRTRLERLERAARLASLGEDCGPPLTPREHELYRWKAHPEFAGRLRELVAPVGSRCRRYAIARKARGVRALDERRHALSLPRDLRVGSGTGSRRCRTPGSAGWVSGLSPPPALLSPRPRE
jgi:hypothetical protein